MKLLEIKTEEELLHKFLNIDTKKLKLLMPSLDFEKSKDEQWVSLESLKKRLNTVMNVRNNEKSMRLLIIELQQELKGE